MSFGSSLALVARLRWAVVGGLLPRHRDRVLGIGCGQGGFASLVARDHKYAGFERADDSCEGGDRRVASFPVACIYNAAMTESRTLRAPVGALISSEAPEHLADDRGALKSSLRLFANGRSVVFSAPANSSRFSCWDSIPGHFRRHDYARIRALLANLELVADGIYLYAFPLLFLTEWLPQESCERRRRNQTDTKASGQLLQSGRFIARLVDIGILPFRIAQGPFLRTKVGTGWAVTARPR